MEKWFEVKHLYKSFGKVEVLKDITLDIRKKEVLAIIGLNGAGKTTLVKTINGLYTPSEGSISSDTSLKEHVGMQFQMASYPMSYRVKDFVEFFWGIRKYNIKDPKNADTKKMFDFFELDTIMKRPASKISGGQNTILGIYLALFFKPKLVFLDEFTTVIDLHKKYDYIKYVKDFCQNNNIDIVMVSHDLDEIFMMSDRIIVLQEGKIVKEIKTKNTTRDKLIKYIDEMK